MTATHPYAQYLGTRDPLEVLAETQRTIPAIVQKLGPEGLKRSYAPGKWTAAQVLAHLADAEVAFGFRVRQIVSEPALAIQPFDETRWAKNYDKASGAEAAQAFQALRAWNLSCFRLLTKEERERAANHPDRGPEKADTVIRILAGHTLNHLAQLEKIVSNATAA
jgi:uncharacterized damage-inducible protein DinB